VSSLVKSLSPQAARAKAHDRAFNALRSLPPFSPVLDRVLASLGGEDVELSQLASLIEKDVVLSGRILQLVNSASISRREPITAVPRALAVLGLDKLRNTILGISVGRIWGQARTPASFSMARFGAHSAAVAALSDLLAQRVRTHFPEGAFVAGLLHDIGHLLIATGLPEMYAEAQGQEEAVLGFTHQTIGAEALNFWKLPVPVQDAVAAHHAKPQAAHVPVPLGELVQAADCYVNSIGASIMPSCTAPEPDTSALEELGLNDSQIKELVDEFECEFQQTSAFFS
jgi:putative nucleotidyltransferase with HDIG domain